MRVMITVLHASAVVANQAAANLSGNPADAGTFGPAFIGPIGSSSPTHTGCGTYMNDMHLPSLPSLAASIPGLKYTTDHPGQDTTDPACISSVDGTPLTWDQFLSMQGLQVIQPATIP